MKGIKPAKPLAIDLFCGIGGLTRGLIDSGIPVVAGYDLDDTCRYAYETNNGATFFRSDVTSLSGAEILLQYPSDCTKILVGCAPCQPFSTHTRKIKRRELNDDWQLLDSFSRLIEEIQPMIVSMENVFELSNTDVFKRFLATLVNQDYHVSWKRIYCPDYGVPQTRRRLVLLASRFGEINIVPPTNTASSYPTVREAIDNLPPITAGEVCAADFLHRSPALNELNTKRIHQSKPGGTWRDWNTELLSPCHKRITGKSYSGVYSRMSWDGQAPTMTTQFYNFGTGRFGHPDQNRAISLREGALLQTFPPDYQFIDPAVDFSMRRIGKHIGNAVPVRLGYVIGKSITEHLGRVNDNGDK